MVVLLVFVTCVVSVVDVVFIPAFVSGGRGGCVVAFFFIVSLLIVDC